jgi:type I restriction enzyme S subunit
MEKLLPQLRFPEFKGEWEVEKLLKHVKSISSGKIKPSNEGIFPLYGSTGVIGKSNTFSHDGDYLLVARVGANAGQINRAKGKYAVTDNTLVVDLKENISVSFCESFLRKYNLNKLVFGSGQPLITGGLLKSIDFIFPSLPEQTKIATFLTAVDEKLTALKQKKILLEQYKKGVMQQIFSQELRFKDDNGNDFADWEEKKLGEVAKRVVRKNKENNLNVLTISAQQGLISQLEYFNKSVSAKNVTNYYLLEENDFAYNKSYSKGYPMGAIKRLNKYDKGVVSTLYICFVFNKNVSLEFMEHYFEFGLQNNEIEKVAQEGARNHGLLNIGVNDFLGIDILFPSSEEQTKIANFLVAIDEKINHCQDQIEKAGIWKKGLLQQMFV